MRARSQPQIERNKTREHKTDVFQSPGLHPKVLHKLAQQPQELALIPFGSLCRTAGGQRIEKWTKVVPSLNKARKGRELVWFRVRNISNSLWDFPVSLIPTWAAIWMLPGWQLETPPLELDFGSPCEFLPAQDIQNIPRSSGMAV